MSKSTKPSKLDKVSKRVGMGNETARAAKAVESVLVPLTELFGDVDEVFREEGAFDKQNIHKSLGRIYRSWLQTREALDPDFDREKYRQKMKKRRPQRTGLTAPLVSDSPTRSMGRTQISEKSQKQTAKQEKRSAKKSVKGARSSGNASHGR